MALAFASAFASFDAKDSLSRHLPHQHPKIIVQSAPLTLPHDIIKLLTLHAAVPVHLLAHVPRALHTCYEQGEAQNYGREGGGPQHPRQGETTSPNNHLALLRYHVLTLCNALDSLTDDRVSTAEICWAADAAIDDLRQAWDGAVAHMLEGWPRAAILCFNRIVITSRSFANSSSAGESARLGNKSQARYHNKTTSAFLDRLARYVAPAPDPSIMTDSTYTGRADIHDLVAGLRLVLLRVSAILAVADDVGIYTGRNTRSTSTEDVFKSTVPISKKTLSWHLWSFLFRWRTEAKEGRSSPANAGERETQMVVRILSELQCLQSPLNNAKLSVDHVVAQLELVGNLTVALASAPWQPEEASAPGDSVSDEGDDTNPASSRGRFDWLKNHIALKGKKKKGNNDDDDETEWWRGSPWVREQHLIGNGGLGGLERLAVGRIMYFLSDLGDMARDIEAELRRYGNDTKELQNSSSTMGSIIEVSYLNSFGNKQRQPGIANEKNDNGLFQREIFSPSLIQAYVALLAVLSAGAIGVPLSSSFSESRIQSIAQLGGITHLIDLTDPSKQISLPDVTRLTLDLCGRLDCQLKISGQQFEPREVKNKLLSALGNFKELAVTVATLKGNASRPALVVLVVLDQSSVMGKASLTLSESSFEKQRTLAELIDLRPTAESQLQEYDVAVAGDSVLLERF
ncbi:hypothetical protein CORC01_06615 [Colletotrichum orchidophilum]|uniref:Uncharacterized protein n=1 Tax=Colletotrichum orchidophilum TaxID=1209926 RepID=A0A1G4B9N2_9PEZI|nr:uncharacterized protein CORC01_06615 [Colletotrichum orchidophilum]OHE98101.1 hypothetical protein CORC01_06615 [Colletotrichum orchidophilum]